MSLTERLTRPLRRYLRNWALRRGSPERLPVILRQSRVYVLPTGTGLAILGTLLLMFVAAINYSLSLGFALTFFLGSVGVVHILLAWRTLTGLQVGLQAGGEAFAGARTEWQVTLTNQQKVERPAIEVRDEEGYTHQAADVAAHTTVQVPLRLPCPRRGWLQPGVLVIETRQPLGWIRAWSYLAPDAPVLVFPEPRGALPLPVMGVASGESAVGNAPGQDDFAGLRVYQPGDSLRHIAWKQLARGQGLLTKTFAGGRATGCALDWFALPAGMATEDRLSQLTRWVLEARDADMTTTLLLPGLQVGPGSGMAHHHECLRHLALFGREGPAHA